MITTTLDLSLSIQTNRHRDQKIDFSGTKDSLISGSGSWATMRVPSTLWVLDNRTC